MFSARRLPVYVLHDGSGEAISGLSRLVDSLRCDPQALEIVWLSFISLAGTAKQTVPLTELCSIGNAGVVEAENGAPELDGGLSIFESDAQKNLRARTTSTHAGDWRPTLVLYLAANPQGEVSGGLDAIKARRCGHKLAFLGPAVSPLARARLKDGGFELIDVVDGLVEPGSGGGAGRPWPEVLCRAIFGPDAWRAAPVAVPDLPPPPVVLDVGLTPNVSEVPVSEAAVPGERDVVRPKSAELKTSNLFTVDLGNLSTDGRVTRRGLLLYLLLYFGIIVLSVFIGYLSVTLASIVGTVAWGIFVLGLIKRAHDLGLSGWYILIPFFGFWLFLAPGEVGPNKFGQDPRASGDVGESGGR